MSTTIQSLIDQVRDVLLEAAQLASAGAPTVTPQGTAGATTYTYKIVATNADGHAIASQPGSTTTGNAALSGSNYNALTWAQVQGATGYDVYRTVGGATQGKIGTCATGATVTFNDTGLAGDATTAPTTNTTLLSGGFWTDNELVAILNHGIRDLKRAIDDTYQDFFLTIDETNVSVAANATTLTGVPTDVVKVLGLEPRTLSDYPDLVFRPKSYVHADFQSARAQQALDPGSGGTVYYHLRGAGGPVGATVVDIAPALSAGIPLRLIYKPVVGPVTIEDTNPIPGESDEALKAWTIGWAKAKDTENQQPDATWIGAYATEKQNILASITPRQEDEEEVVESMFEGYWPN